MITLFITLKTVLTGQSAKDTQEPQPQAAPSFEKLCQKDMAFGPAPLHSVLRNSRAKRRTAIFAAAA